MKLLKCLFAVSIICAFMLSCRFSGEPITEVQSFIHGEDEITAGNRFKLTPLKEGIITLEGDRFSVNKFEFNCVLLSSESEIDTLLYTDVTAIDLSSSGFTHTTKYSSKITKWPSSVTEQKVTFSFPIMPGETYSGSGYFYFYIVNDKEECISNIIKWRVKFK